MLIFQLKVEFLLLQNAFFRNGGRPVESWPQLRPGNAGRKLFGGVGGNRTRPFALGAEAILAHYKMHIPAADQVFRLVPDYLPMHFMVDHTGIEPAITPFTP